MSTPGRLILRAHVFLLAGVIPLLVRVLPLKGLLRLLTPPERVRPYRGASAREIASAVRGRLRRPRHMRRRRCLREGLLLFHFLCLSGRSAVLRVGVYAGAGGRSRAHCWVTLDGESVSAPPDGPVAEVLTHARPGAAAG